MAVSAAALSVGDSRQLVLVEDLTRTQIIMYAGASGDFFPIHHDERFAVEVAGYPGMFAHGMLTMGMTGRLLTDWFGDGRLTTYGVRFVKPVWPGDRLVATARIDAIRQEEGGLFADVSIETVNRDDERVLRGSATARLDP